MSEFAVVATGQTGAALGSVVGVALLTRVLAPSDYGRLALALTVTTLVQQLLFSPVVAAGLRFYAPQREQDALGVFFRVLTTLCRDAYLSFVLIGVSLLFILWFAGFSEWLSIACAALVFSAVSGAISIWDSIQNAARNRLVVAFHQMAGEWLRFSLAYTFVFIFSGRSSAALWGYAAGATATLISYGFVTRTRLVDIARQSRGTPNGQNLRLQMLRYATPFSFWGLLSWAQVAVDRWAIRFAATERDVGLYAVVYQVGYYPLILVFGIVSQLVSPIVFERAGDAGDPERTRRSRTLMRSIVLIGLASTVGVAVAAHLLHSTAFRWLVAPEYWSASWLLPVMALAGGIFGVAQLAALQILIRFTSHSLLFPKIITGATGVLLSVAGAAYFGVPGVVAANFTTGVFYLVWTLLLWRKQA